MLDHNNLLESIRAICKADPTKSVSGLAEALGAYPNASRQWKSEKVKVEVEKIEAAMAVTEKIMRYLSGKS